MRHPLTKVTAVLTAVMLAISSASPVVAQELPAEAIPNQGPFAPWGIPTPPGAENYEPNQVANADLTPQGLTEWHPTTNPQARIVEGEMRSDKEAIPSGWSAHDANRAETTEAALQMLRAAPGCGVYCPSWFEVCGAIKEKYDTIGEPTSFLNLPKSNELTNPDGVGKRSEFVNGFIYWHPENGAHSVSIPVSAVWQRHGWEAGFLGYPTSSDIPLGEDWYQQSFQGGYVYTHNAPIPSQASIQGAIFDKWQSLGAQNSSLEYPLSDELTTPDGKGRYNVFQGGVIYWHPETGAHPVTEPVLSDWAAAGFERSPYGCPLDDGHIEGDFAIQQFQGGQLDAPISNPLMHLEAVPYLPFPSRELAEEFFDRVEAGLETIPAPEDPMSRALGTHYGPCYLSVDKPHPRKSSNFQGVGIKVYTNCTESPTNVTHANTLRYKYYYLWKATPEIDMEIDFSPVHVQENKIPRNLRSKGITDRYKTEYLVQPCAGDGGTTFIGTAVGEIVTPSGTYYARAWSRKARIDCIVPNG